MAFTSVNPATGETLAEVAYWDATRLDSVLQQVADATPGWAATPVEGRALLIRRLGEILREQRDQLAVIITREMGKLIGEARGEIDKCAWLCDYYAESGPGFLADELLESDATRSMVVYQPLGTILAVMPWNFPFWQVFRFAVPGLLAGNTGLLKHASNVPQCAKSIENLFIEAGFPEGVFRSLMIGASQVESVIADPRVQAVTLTGSDSAGRKVAAAAGAHLKKSVLELGGSDPFVVLKDADLDGAAKAAVTSRFLNGGQSCIAAKRFILVDDVAKIFLERFKAGVEALVPGDPMTAQATLPPMARTDLRDDLHKQVVASIEQGAEAVTGCRPLEGEGAFYAASILDRVKPGMPAYAEELFGPVAIVLRARDEADALRLANDSPFGLGGCVWSADAQRGEAFARALECGCAFVNGMVKSDPRLPFGGVKQSGYGRELSRHGIREFVNAKTIWIR